MPQRHRVPGSRRTGPVRALASGCPGLLNLGGFWSDPSRRVGRVRWERSLKRRAQMPTNSLICSPNIPRVPTPCPMPGTQRGALGGCGVGGEADLSAGGRDRARPRRLCQCHRHAWRLGDVLPLRAYTKAFSGHLILTVTSNTGTVTSPFTQEDTEAWQGEEVTRLRSHG